MATQDWKTRDRSKEGYGKHAYNEIDPDTINPADYARTFGGEEEFFGDVREYNSAYNEKHPENNVQLDWLCRVGTSFSTEAKGFNGEWRVVDVPIVLEGKIFIVCADDEILEQGGDYIRISAVDLGLVVDEKNYFLQVKTVLIEKGKVSKDTRKKLTQRDKGNVAESEAASIGST